MVSISSEEASLTLSGRLHVLSSMQIRTCSMSRRSFDNEEPKCNVMIPIQDMTDTSEQAGFKDASV
jgi:hypothetical protein